MDSKLPVALDDFIEENHGLETVLMSGNINAPRADSFTQKQELPLVSDESQKTAEVISVLNLGFYFLYCLCLSRYNLQ